MQNTKKKKSKIKIHMDLCAVEEIKSSDYLTTYSDYPEVVGVFTIRNAETGVIHVGQSVSAYECLAKHLRRKEGWATGIKILNEGDEAYVRVIPFQRDRRTGFNGPALDALELEWVLKLGAFRI